MTFEHNEELKLPMNWRHRPCEKPNYWHYWH